MAVVVYLVAGLFAAWSYSNDRWWQRLLLIVGWMPLFLYGLICDVVEWTHRHGYQYPTDDEDEDEELPQEWEWP